MADRKYWREEGCRSSGYDPYGELAGEIVLRAIKDYRKTKDEDEAKEIERFFRSDWADTLCYMSGWNRHFILKNLKRLRPATGTIVFGKKRKEIIWEVKNGQ